MSKQTRNSFLSFALDDECNVIIKRTKMQMQVNDKYKNTECGICLSKFCEILYDIAILECGHKFCVECIRALKKKEKTQFYRCPTCKKENEKGHIIDSYNKINDFIHVKSNKTEKKEKTNPNRVYILSIM